MDDFKFTDPIIKSQFDLLANWSKKCIDMLEESNIEDISTHPNQPYILAACSKLGMSDIMLSLQIGNLAMSWLSVLLHEKEQNQRIDKLVCFDKLTMIARSLPYLTSSQMFIISNLLYSINVVICMMLENVNSVSKNISKEQIKNIMISMEKMMIMIKEVYDQIK